MNNEFNAQLDQLEEREYDAYVKAIGERGAAFLLDCVDLSGAEYVNPVARAITASGNTERFAKLIKTISMLSFHYGWLAKTEDML